MAFPFPLFFLMVRSLDAARAIDTAYSNLILPTWGFMPHARFMASIGTLTAIIGTAHSIVPFNEDSMPESCGKGKNYFRIF